MGKNKLQRFADNIEFKCVIEPLFEDIFRKDHFLKGNWASEFENDNPIVLELGCGKGEYAVELARKHPNMNFIGVDIKGARFWRGAKTATDLGLTNIRFLRTRIEFISSFFSKDEISSIWITFPDPQLHKSRVKKRLTSPMFLLMYREFLKDGGTVRLKTDSLHLHLYTKALLEANQLPIIIENSDIYRDNWADEILSIKTHYEKIYLDRGVPITYIEFLLPKTLNKQKVLTEQSEVNNSENSKEMGLILPLERFELDELL